MPTYQYACTSCGEQLEAVQRFSDDPLTVCPACGGALRKVFSPVGIVFKGSGFYRTDSRNGMVPGAGKNNGEKPTGDKDKSGGDKVTTKANGSGESSSSDSKSSSDSGSSSSDGKKSADKKPAKAASAGSGS